MTIMPAKLAYNVAIDSIAKHTLSVTLHIPANSTHHSLTLSLPAWIPGSYMIRDFARNILAIAASDGQGNPLAICKTDKQTWQVTTHGQAATVTYQVYAFDLSVRSAFISDEYAFCNGTSVFLCVEECQHYPCEISVQAPAYTPDWLIHTSMTCTDDNLASPQFFCENYLEAIDHPIFIGRATTTTFVVNNVTFTLLFSGSTPVNVERIARDLAPVCAHHLTLFGAPSPVKDYLFMTLLADDGYGGLEHRNSTALLYPRLDLPLNGEEGEKSDAYINFISLCSHELFHTWHVKRLKPDVMVKPDLSQETYTNQLWIYEGFTSFYDDVTLARSGVISPPKYLEILAQSITRVLQNEGRHKQSAAESSFDAWTRFYKQDAGSVNHIVSYYTKGGLIALGLDLLLRQRSDNAVTLDTVMQTLWTQYGVNEAGTPDSVIADVCSDSFNIDISDYLTDVVYGKKDVPLADLLASVGVTYHTRVKQGKDDKGGTPANSQSHTYQLGALVKAASLGVSVAQITDDLAASKAGLQLNDQIIAIGSEVVNENKLQRLLDTQTGDHVKLTVIRDARLITLKLPLIAPRQDVCYLTLADVAAFDRWLGLLSE